MKPTESAVILEEQIQSLASTIADKLKERHDTSLRLALDRVAIHTSIEEQLVLHREKAARDAEEQNAWARVVNQRAQVYAEEQNEARQRREAGIQEVRRGLEDQLAARAAVKEAELDAKELVAAHIRANAEQAAQEALVASRAKTEAARYAAMAVAESNRALRLREAEKKRIAAEEDARIVEYQVGRAVALRVQKQCCARAHNQHARVNVPLAPNAPLQKELAAREAAIEAAKRADSLALERSVAAIRKKSTKAIDSQKAIDAAKAQAWYEARVLADRAAATAAEQKKLETRLSIIQSLEDQIAAKKLAAEKQKEVEAVALANARALAEAQTAALKAREAAKAGACVLL